MNPTLTVHLISTEFYFFNLNLFHELLRVLTSYLNCPDRF